MNKLKIYFMNGFYSALIGAAVEIIMAIVKNCDFVYIKDLLSSMLSGILIGTISVFFIINIILRFKIKLIVAILSNTMVMLAFFLLPFGREYNLSSYLIFIIIEALSIILTVIAHREMSLYNRMLKRKQLLSTALSETVTQSTEKQI